MRAQLLVISFLAVIHGLPLVAQADETGAAETAYRAGLADLKRMKYDEARTALEAALSIAPDDEFRIKTYEALSQIYRRLPELAPMIQAQEFLIAAAPNRTKRLSPANDLTSFLFQRGGIETQSKLYEDTLNEQPDNLVALTMLRNIYRSKREKKSRLAEITAQLDKIEIANSAKHAEAMESRAADEPRRAATWWKDAAVAWRDAGEKVKALAAAAQAEKASLPASNISAHFFHRHLGEVYADCDKPQEAIAHLEQAIEATTIEGYRNDCRTLIAKLRAKPNP